MSVRDLSPPEGYDPASQFSVAHFAAQLTDQLGRLKEVSGGLSVAQLEWQPRPGVNTIGMRLAHIAVAECWWLGVLPHGISPEPEVEKRFVDALGIGMDDDGLPLAADGVHPNTLRGKTLGDYHDLLDRARAAAHLTVRAWTDGELSLEHETLRQPVTRRWILYYVMQHTAAHLGQILLLKHLAATAGILLAQDTRA